jgi:uncharacterized cupin superfamily protein
MQPTLLPGIAMWSRWQADRSMFFNAWLIDTPVGTIAVDPLEPDADDLAFVDARGLHAVVITNRDHERAAARFVERYAVPVFAPEPDAAEIGVRVDRVLRDGDDVGGWRVVMFEGFKTPGELALVRDRVAITGDAFWGVPAGALRLMPDEKLADPARAARSARRLLAANVRHLLVGDGMPVFHHAFEALATMLDARRDAFVRRINLDEVTFADDDPPGPAPFTAVSADVGRMLGATRLGYVLGRLDPGVSYCPYHWHTREEEMLVVWRGAATLRTPAGTFAVRAGDVVAFPTGESGAHRLTNESDAPCFVLITAGLDAGDACFYPDSRKLLVESTGAIVRAEPELDYFDGEVPTP